MHHPIDAPLATEIHPLRPGASMGLATRRARQASPPSRVEHEILEPDSDVHALTQEGVVSVTPPSHDLTSRPPFDQIAQALQ